MSSIPTKIGNANEKEQRRETPRETAERARRFAEEARATAEKARATAESLRERNEERAQIIREVRESLAALRAERKGQA